MKADLNSRVSDFFSNALVQNALSLYGVQVMSYLVPFIAVPYLARVLGASGWGLVAFSQAFGSWVAILGEYGFSLSGTREVARYRGNKDKLTDILAGILGAKTLLAAASIVIALLARWAVPVFREHPALLWSGLFWALGQGFSMMWFFQGFEKMRLVAALDVSFRALATVGIFAFVRRPGDECRVLIVQGSGFFLSFVVCLGLAYRELPVRFPSWVSVWRAFRIGWSMFLFRGSVSLYTTGNAFLLGLFVSPKLVGYYAGAEKISKAFLGMLNPISQTLYPRVSHLVWHSRYRAARLAQVGAAVMGTAGTTMGILIFLLAPLLVQLTLGQEFLPAVPVLRVISLLVPLIAFSNVFGVQWMLPLGLDKPFNTIILLAGLINLVLALGFAPRFAEIGMAWAVVLAEAFVSGAMYIILRSRKLDPFSYAANTEGKIA